MNALRHHEDQEGYEVSLFDNPTDAYDWSVAEKSARVRSLEDIVSKLKEVQETVQALGESGQLGDGPLVTISNQLRDAFTSCEKVHEEATNMGAMTTAWTALVSRPQDAEVPVFTSMFSDRGFCVTLLKLKVEQFRILQGKPEEGPALTLHNCCFLEFWGSQLTDAIMKTWGRLLRCHVGSDEIIDPNWNGTPRLVSRAFAMTICNLIYLQLNLWPKIKGYLDDWNLRGHHVFPQSMWGNPYLNAIMNLEPRCISFIANAGHIDINELARSGPMRRSDTARNLWQTLSPDQRLLMNNGVEFLRENFKRKRFVFQGVRWNAMLYEWPRETMPTLEDLMERVLN